MQETQNIEWKETWRDEYLKWLCGFANTQGGRLEIGRADNGAVVGAPRAKRLLDELPNKIRSAAPSQQQVGTKSGLSREQVNTLAFFEAERALLELMTRSGRTNRTKYKQQILNPLLAAGLLEYTIPGKPTSRLQKYLPTEKGRRWLAAGDAVPQP
jgi:predicted HTH transcriptional regulator